MLAGLGFQLNTERSGEFSCRGCLYTGGRDGRDEGREGGREGGREREGGGGRERRESIE